MLYDIELYIHATYMYIYAMYFNKLLIVFSSKLYHSTSIYIYIYIYIQWRSQDFSEGEAIVTTQL